MTSILISACPQKPKADLPICTISQEIVKSSLNERVHSAIDRIFKEKARQIYWIPHPKFEESDRLHLPHEVDIFDIYRRKSLVFFFGLDKMVQILSRLNVGESAFGRNIFLKWLNEDNHLIDSENFFRSKRECFMNCTDFVYLILYQAGLISKEKIAAVYRREIERQLSSAESDTFYGLPLKAFKNFDLKNGSQGETPKPGDILIGFVNEKPVHVLFLSGKNPVTGRWKGAGLWRVGARIPNPADVELDQLQNDYYLRCNHQTLVFKYCSLETVVQAIRSEKS